MSMRTYTVYLEGGASLQVRAARFEARKDGVFFFDEADRPLEDTYINPSVVIAVVPPSSSTAKGAFLSS